MAVLTQTLNSIAYGTTAGEFHVLDAINEVLEAINELPITAVPSSSAGASVHARALKMLERCNIEMQTMGFPENTEYAVTEDLASRTQITDEALSIKANGKDGHRTLVLRRDTNNENNIVYDTDSGTVIGTGEVCIDIINKIPFHACSYELQRNIITSASMKFQRRIQGSPQADQALLQERQFSDYMVDRTSPLKRNVPLDNLQSPFSTQASQQQLQQPQQRQG